MGGAKNMIERSLRKRVGRAEREARVERARAAELAAKLERIEAEHSKSTYGMSQKIIRQKTEINRLTRVLDALLATPTQNNPEDSSQ